MRNILADKPRVTKFPIEFDAPVDSIPVAGDVSGAIAAEEPVPTPGGFGANQQQQQQQQQQAAAGMPSAAQFGSGGGAFGEQQQQQQQHQMSSSGGFAGVHLSGQFDAVAQVCVPNSTFAPRSSCAVVST